MIHCDATCEFGAVGSNNAIVRRSYVVVRDVVTLALGLDVLLNIERPRSECGSLSSYNIVLGGVYGHACLATL